MTSQDNITPSSHVSINVTRQESSPRLVHEDEHGRRYESPALATCGREPVSSRGSFDGSVIGLSVPANEEQHLISRHHHRTSPVVIHQDEYGRRYQSNALATRRSLSSDVNSQSTDDPITIPESEDIDVNDDDIRHHLSFLITSFVLNHQEYEHRTSEEINTILNETLAPLSQVDNDDVSVSGYSVFHHWRRFVHCRSKCIICKWTADTRDQHKRPFECKRCFSRKCFDCCRDEFKKDLHSKDRTFSCRACRAPITDAVAKRFIGDFLYKKILYFRSRREFAQDSTALWCPKEGCWKLLVSRLNPLASNQRNLSCPDCGTDVCRSCGQNKDTCVCLISQNLHARDELWKLIHTRRCPSCECPIVRWIGCVRFHCTNCGNHLCWRCRSFIDCEGGIPKKHRCSGMGMMRRLKNIGNFPIQFTGIVINSVLNSRTAANQPLCISR